MVPAGLEGVSLQAWRLVHDARQDGMWPEESQARRGAWKKEDLKDEDEWVGAPWLEAERRAKVEPLVFSLQPGSPEAGLLLTFTLVFIVCVFCIQAY